ncbi:cysteine synthase A [Spirochaeta isovalerica]|uniref:Cysteine synthase n=1 Tax=Spirochaeta isovalerica TaxID=150 RepID=A0A841RGK5_9SPIO|nr:cysteine synthase A [Spirochaeta isovalerica]MBB6481462.1 cysteine synthase A [Spirochaeta isovalerica]
MRIYDDITQLVGHTPLVRINSLSDEKGNEIIGKMESFNPLSSIKDRIALAMIEQAEKDGVLKKGGLIVEPTSGNTGIGLAYVAAARGYKIILVMPDTMSMERRNILSALGAELVLTPGATGMKGAIEKAGEILKDNPGSFMPQQFENPANPRVHRETTAREILEDTDGKVDYFVAGIGTGGTITGNGETLKKEIPGIKIIAVEPFGSSVLSGLSPGPHKIQGIGAGFIPKVLNREIIDEIVRISSDEAAETTRNVAKRDGIFLGISAGAALAAAKKIAEKVEGKRIVVILPDSGDRYLSTWIYS